MSTLTPPPKGSMYLFDYITPPLKPDSYQIHVETTVTVPPEQGTSGATETHQLGDDRYFDVVGPRFNLAPTEVAGVFPPRNGHGPFGDALAQIAIKRRTLPWERSLDDNGPLSKPLPPPSDGKGLPAGYPTPWLALLLFEEGEYSLLQGVPLESVVPKTVFQRLGSPSNILCDAVEADLGLVESIMPSKEELQLLSHVRWVNKDDRELSVEGSDGWFAIVMTNRVPSPTAKCRACLVSLEERTDLVKRDPPATAVPPEQQFRVDELQPRDAGAMEIAKARFQDPRAGSARGRLAMQLPTTTRLVLLHSWQFLCEGNGTFFDLMQGLDDGMIGKVQVEGQPPLTDTAHLKLALHDRGGTEEVAWYRGPLVPFQLTRDPLGPYHSADQARRATPETGVEDVSYAAAFEAGRLLAAADARLAQELIRWRRESYKQSGRANVLAAVQSDIALLMPPGLAGQLHTSLVPVVASAAMRVLVQGAGPIADRYGIKSAGKVVGLDPQALSDAWGVSLAEAQTMLGRGAPGTLGVEAPAMPQTPRPDATLNAVAADTAGLQRLSSARDQVIENAKIRVAGGSK